MWSRPARRLARRWRPTAAPSSPPRSTARLRDLAWPLERGRGGRARRDLLRGRPGDHAPLHRARHGAGRAGAVPRGQAGHRPAGQGRLLLRLRRREALHPEDLKAIEKKMQEIQKRGPAVLPPGGHRRGRPARSWPPSRTSWSSSASRAPPPPTTARTSRWARGELTIYDNLDAKTGELCWKDLCRGPHLPTTRNIPAFKLMRNAAAYWRGSEKNPHAPAHLRHRLALQGRAEGAPRASWPRPRSATTASSATSWTCSPSPTRSAPASPSSTPRAASSAGSWRTTRAAGTRRRATSSSTPRTPPRAKLFETSGHLDWYADGMYPPMQLDEGVGLLPQAHELPDAQPDLRRARPLLP